MNTPAVFSYGEVGVDNIIRVPHLPSPERAAFPEDDHYQVGGAAANMAVWLAGWGIPVALTGNLLGADDLGEDLLTWLSEYPALDLRWLRVEPNAATPFCRILVTPDGERTILVFGYPDAQVVELRPEMLAGVRYLSVDLYGGEERVAAAKAAQEAGVETLVNDVIEVDHPIVAFTDWIVNSAAYLREALPDIPPTTRARELGAATGGPVLTTDGPDPVHLIDGEGNESWIQPPPVEAVDATGAGDAFRAGLVYGLLAGRSLTDCARLGAAAGALKVASAAAEAPPSVERLLAEADRIEIEEGAPAEGSAG